ncbi:hypothetical protein AKJ39_01395 [candidate division MSBL1 archaeon SCGC-AAA259J03]|uniref:HEAT repeat domain-containing protein n=1 Tax=candidate division MSBL1 archaeon SCGC-AAA259J03 TaxID=1698269 RepID=A0A656YWR7_9EURY|nr:hypothetical protein AKJ39_01395 [candidate division MSBL1 archaeon SCGC-AAA259J03]
MNNIVNESESPRIRKSCIKALGELGSDAEESLRILLELAEKDPEVSEEALNALNNIIEDFDSPSKGIDNLSESEQSKFLNLLASRYS